MVVGSLGRVEGRPQASQGWAVVGAGAGVGVPRTCPPWVVVVGWVEAGAGAPCICLLSFFIVNFR